MDAVAVRRGAPPSAIEAFEALSDHCLYDSYRLAAVVLRDEMEAQDVVHDAAQRRGASMIGL